MSPPNRRRTLLAAAAALAVALAGCDTGDGRTLEPPPPGATAPTLPTSSTSTTPTTTGPASLPVPASPPDDASLVSLSSPAFAAESTIPDRFTCEGDDLSPSLTWNTVPPATAELAIVVSDPDAPGGDFLHWLVTGIDPATTFVAEGELPEAAVEVRPWTGPCPPVGEVHEYVFTLYVLDQPSGIVADADPDAARATVESTYSQAAIFHATFGRPG